MIRTIGPPGSVLGLAWSAIYGPMRHAMIGCSDLWLDARPLIPGRPDIRSRLRRSTVESASPDTNAIEARRPPVIGLFVVCVGILPGEPGKL